MYIHYLKNWKKSNSVFKCHSMYFHTLKAVGSKLFVVVIEEHEIPRPTRSISRICLKESARKRSGLPGCVFKEIWKWSEKRGYVLWNLRVYCFPSTLRQRNRSGINLQPPMCGLSFLRLRSHNKTESSGKQRSMVGLLDDLLCNPVSGFTFSKTNSHRQSLLALQKYPHALSSMSLH